jgi:hypothetical protein
LRLTPFAQALLEKIRDGQHGSHFVTRAHFVSLLTRELKLPGGQSRHCGEIEHGLAELFDCFDAKLPRFNPTADCTEGPNGSLNDGRRIDLREALLAIRVLEEPHTHARTKLLEAFDCMCFDARGAGRGDGQEGEEYGRDLLQSRGSVRSMAPSMVSMGGSMAGSMAGSMGGSMGGSMRSGLISRGSLHSRGSLRSRGGSRSRGGLRSRGGTDDDAHCFVPTLDAVRMVMVAAVTAGEREETGRRMLERVTVHSKRVLGLEHASKYVSRRVFQQLIAWSPSANASIETHDSHLHAKFKHADGDTMADLVNRQMRHRLPKDGTVQPLLHTMHCTHDTPCTALTTPHALHSLHPMHCTHYTPCTALTTHHALHSLHTMHCTHYSAAGGAADGGRPNGGSVLLRGGAHACGTGGVPALPRGPFADATRIGTTCV